MQAWSVTPLLPLCVLSGMAAALVTGTLLIRDRAGKESPQVVPMVAAVVIGATVSIGLLVLMVKRDAGWVRWDEAIEKWAATHATELSTNVLTAITQLGSTWFIILISVVVAAYGFIREHRWQILAFMSILVAGQSLLSNVIKWAVGRERPSLAPLAPFSSHSFPSGHTTAAAATYLGIALVVGLFLRSRGRAFITGAAVGLAVAVGCSRVLLGVHWYTDVVAGLILGWSWFAVCWWLFGGRRFALGAGFRDARRPSRRQPTLS